MKKPYNKKAQPSVELAVKVLKSGKKNMTLKKEWSFRAGRFTDYAHILLDVWSENLFSFSFHV